MERENKRIEPIVSISKDRSVMNVNIQKASDGFLTFLLSSLGGSNSVFDIRYYIDGKVVSFESTHLITDDPEIDEQTISSVIADMKNAKYLEIEKIGEEPQKAKPYVEHYISKKPTSS